MREAAFEAIGEFGHAARGAVPALTELIKKDRWTRYHATKALEKLQGK